MFRFHLIRIVFYKCRILLFLDLSKQYFKSWRVVNFCLNLYILIEFLYISVWRFLNNFITAVHVNYHKFLHLQTQTHQNVVRVFLRLICEKQSATPLVRVKFFVFNWEVKLIFVSLWTLNKISNPCRYKIRF